MEVYKIINKTTGKIYIGSTSYDKETRFYNTDWGHVHSMSTGRKGKLYDDMRLYGINDFILETIEIIEDKNNLYNRENYYIKQYWDKYGEEKMYNMQRGISAFYEGMTVSEERKKQLSKAHTNIPLSEEHKKSKRTKFYYDDKTFYGIEELVEYLNQHNIYVTKNIIKNLFYHNYLSKKNREKYPELLEIKIDKIQKKKKACKENIMNYIMIRTDDMLNGSGLRVVLFCTACNHRCKNCHNPETWDASNGIKFNNEAKEMIIKELQNDYISGLTLSGGDPLHENNLKDVYNLCKEVKEKFPNKTIWIYSGFTWEDIFIGEEDERRKQIIKLCDVFVDDVYVDELSDVNYKWAGSTNQKIINVQESLKQNKIVLYCD